MDITITKAITSNGKFKLEVTGDYNGDKKTLDKIYNAVTDVATGTTDRISNANDVLAVQLWNSIQALSEAKQGCKKLQETIEFDNIQIAHYDDELKQAETLLKTILPCTGCAYARNRIEKFLNRGANDDENS